MIDGIPPHIGLPLGGILFLIFLSMIYIPIWAAARRERRRARALAMLRHPAGSYARPRE